jgi:TonB family protein
MKKEFLTTVLFILLSAVLAPAQEAVSARWNWITPEGEEFAILMPQVHVRVRRILPFSDNLNLSPPNYEVGYRGVFYSVLSFERLEGTSIPKTLDGFVEGFRYAFLHSHKSVRNSMTFERDLKLKGHTVKQYLLRAGDSEGTAQVYETPKHFYVVMTVGAKAGEPLADNFFNSFSLDKQTAKETSNAVSLGRLPLIAPTAPKPLWHVAGPTGVIIGNRDEGVIGPIGPIGPAPSGAARPQTDGKKVISGGVLNGKAVIKPQPTYPAIAAAARAQGVVVVQIIVDEEGYVISASAVSGHPLLQQAAVNAARQSRFTPTLLEGQPVKVSGVITYNFVLTSKKPDPTPTKQY